MKKILDFIFEPVNEEDEEEVVVEAPIVKHTFNSRKEEVENKKVNKTIDTSNTNKPSVSQSDVVSQKAAEVKKNDTLNKKPSFGIEVDSAKPVSKRSTKPVEVKTFKAEKKYDFQPPMSPIFGVLENHKDSRVIVDNTHSSHNHVQVKSHIGTVLSPIYGTIQTHDEEIEVISDNIDDTLEKVEVKQIIEDQEKTSLNEEVTVNKSRDSFKEYFEVNEIKDEDIKNTSIDDILIKPQDETYIFSRDISLFDDEVDN